MIPVGDVIPTRTRPFATLASLAAALLAGGPIVQMVANAAALWVFGRTIEDRLGHGRFVAFAAVGALVSAVTRTATSPLLPLTPTMVSGAVAAIVAAYLVLYPRSKVLVLVPVGLPPQIVEAPAFVFLAIWFLLQVIGGLGTPAGFAATPIPGLVPSWGHLASLAAGAAAIFLFRRPERQRVEWWNDRPAR
jgi:membrane associated rhomboid family serine protease